MQDRSVLSNALLVLFGLESGPPVRKIDPGEYARTHCCSCNTDIPPGRPGRKCKDCRKEKNDGG